MNEEWINICWNSKGVQVWYYTLNLTDRIEGVQENIDICSE